MRKATGIDQIREAEFSLISVPWKSVKVFVKVRELTDLQIQSIGQFSLITDGKSAPIKDIRSIEEMASLHNNIVKASLVSPTYKEIFELVGKSDFTKECEEKYIEIEKQISEMEIGPERSALEKRAASVKLFFSTVLPNDFTSAIVEYALGINKSDIKLVTREILLNCAILQSRSGGRPSDYCVGSLSDFNKRDIDTKAFIIFDEYMKQKKGKAV